MPDAVPLNPAEAAAEEALETMLECIHERQNFRLEAGAGAGKTYSLVKAMQRIIDVEGAQLILRRQKVACITYTNVATDEVTSRTDGHPAVQASTIHSFCWDLCKSFQSILREKALDIPRLSEKVDEAGGLAGQRVAYDLGHRRVTETEILLHHDDVLKLMVMLLEYPKFRRILAARFPILFIDEYQDSDAEFAESLVRNFVEAEEGPLIGLFGDSWQKIYRTGIGAIEHQNLLPIGKKANFRSVPEIVAVLNRIRPELPQGVSDPAATGSVHVYHSNNFGGQRLTGGHWAGDLPADQAHGYLTLLREQLTQSGWDFSLRITKILMLTHNVLAAVQNYSRVLDVFEFNDSLFQKEDPHLALLRRPARRQGAGIQPALRRGRGRVARAVPPSPHRHLRQPGIRRAPAQPGQVLRPRGEARARPDPDRLRRPGSNNVYEVTEEWAFHNGHYGTREDVVFLINGIPVLVIECKNANKDEAIALGVDQIRRYHRETPELFVPQQLFTATDAIGFSYGVTWNTVRRNIFNWKHEEVGKLEAKVKSFCAIPQVLAFLKDYIVFAEKDEELNKYILRQHQTGAVEATVGRALDPKRTRGLVWHTQGSGKTFTMIKAAERLFRAPEADKPTVLLMIDRNELEDQMLKNLAALGPGQSGARQQHRPAQPSCCATTTGASS
jgi:hypothetical protein